MAAIVSAATTISDPSTPAAKYSALACPYGALVGGLERPAQREHATTAATRFTTDSAASESRPTDPVSSHATVLSEIVAMAARSAEQLRACAKAVPGLRF